MGLRQLRVVVATLLMMNLCIAANIPATPTTNGIEEEAAPEVRVECDSDRIVVDISTRSGRFNGMVYPRGLSKNSSCMGAWVQRPAPVRYVLPLRGCNTMSTQMDDGGIEYFNTIVVQPHLKLVTNQGKGFHIRCRYNTKNNTVVNDSLKVNLHQAEAVLGYSSPPPPVTMRIFTDGEVAAQVRIGDPLTLEVALDAASDFALRVTDCLVRDGLGWGEQRLIDSLGCPVDPDIMGRFDYDAHRSKATVTFQAHKFPYTESVYYQCNVTLCQGVATDSPRCLPPDAKACATGLTNRVRRQAPAPAEGTPATVEVYSGLYVNEGADPAKPEDDSVFSEKAGEDSFCISQRSFAIGVCIAGLILMACVVAAILCILARRRSKTSSAPGSSIYSGPYTNTAYSHTS